jgi:hypothetical protein
MHGQIGGDETDVIPFALAAKGSAANGADQLDKAGRFCNCSTERLALRKKTADTHWIRRLRKP